MPPTRRNFLQTTATIAAGASLAYAKEQHMLKSIGFQLYTVRDVINQNPEKTLTELSDIGYREAECIGDNLENIVAAMTQTKLKPVSLHVDSNLWKSDHEEKRTSVFADAKMKGFSYVVYPYVPNQERGGMDAIKRVAENLNRGARDAHNNDLKVCYHNHAFEFEPIGGKTLLATLMEETDPKLVGLELDIFWAVTGGHDPLELFNVYGSRIQLVHLKDRAKPAQPHYNEDVPRNTFKEVGHGSIDIPAVLKAATEAGVKHFFVEQDATPGDPVESLKQSYQYLHDLTF
jgi:sugar phosphate isomerase/epimerase